jgi:hypothetical protein
MPHAESMTYGYFRGRELGIVIGAESARSIVFLSPSCVEPIPVYLPNTQGISWIKDLRRLPASLPLSTVVASAPTRPADRRLQAAIEPTGGPPSSKEPRQPKCGNRRRDAVVLAASAATSLPAGPRAPRPLPGSRVRSGHTIPLCCRWKRIRRNHPGR